MADLPILFSAPMVRALLEGRKTQTRRVMNPQPEPDFISAKITDGLLGMAPARLFGGPTHRALRKLHRPGDRLWVREAWRTHKAYDDLPPSEMGGEEAIQHRADGALHARGWPAADFDAGRLRASMHMPRWASRLTLKVTEVHVQRLQDISEEDAVAEGIRPSGYHATFKDMPMWGDGTRSLGNSPRAAFSLLWDSINAGRGFGWDANPWVTATTFEVVRGNIDEVK